MSSGVRRKMSVLVGSALAVALLAGCADRPSSDALTDSILRASASQAIDLTNDQAECIADALLESELNDVTVTGLAENFDQPQVAAADADDVEAIVANAAVSCSGN